MAEAWTPHEQHWRACIGFREREPGRLQLRVALRGHEGVCDILFEEGQETVTVLILVCGEKAPRGERIDCPVHVYLDQPLGDRQVLDLVRDRTAVRLYVASWE